MTTSFQSIISFNNPRGGKTGLTLTKRSDDYLVIKSVAAGGLGEQAGFVAGYHILAINNQTGLSCQEASQLLRSPSITVLVQTPPEFAKTFYKQTKDAYVGVTFCEERNNRVTIAHATPGGLAHSAGVRSGQPVVAINGITGGKDELSALLDETQGLVSVIVEPAPTRTTKLGPLPPPGIKKGGTWGCLYTLGEKSTEVEYEGYIGGGVSAKRPRNTVDAYLALDGQVYDRRGKWLGPPRKLRFKAQADHPRNHLHPLQITTMTA